MVSGYISFIRIELLTKIMNVEDTYGSAVGKGQCVGICERNHHKTDVRYHCDMGRRRSKDQLRFDHVYQWTEIKISPWMPYIVRDMVKTPRSVFIQGACSEDDSLKTPHAVPKEGEDVREH